MYQNMGEILKDRKVGEWELQHFQIKPGNLYAVKPLMTESHKHPFMD